MTRGDGTMMTLERWENPSGEEMGTALSIHLSGERRGSEPREERPLWLTLQEVELLIVLCATSQANGGRAEEPLFSKLGAFFRWFSQ